MVRKSLLRFSHELLRPYVVPAPPEAPANPRNGVVSQLHMTYVAAPPSFLILIIVSSSLPSCSHERLCNLHQAPCVPHPPSSTHVPRTIPRAPVVPTTIPPRIASKRTHQAPRQTDAKLLQQPTNRAARAQQRDHDGEKRLHRVLARIVPQLLNHTLQPMHQVLDVPIPRSALVVAASSAAAEDTSRATETAPSAAEERRGRSRIGRTSVVASSGRVRGARTAV